jgi:chromosome segregation ATPase
VNDIFVFLLAISQNSLLVGSAGTLTGAFLTWILQVRKQNLKKKKGEQDRKDGQQERDANTAKILAETLSQVVESLRGEITAMNERLEMANNKIEHLTSVVSEYSRGVDMLIEQLRSKGEIPVYTRNPQVLP